MKIKIIATILWLLVMTATAVFAGTVTLTTTLPNKLRVSQGAVGADFDNPSSTSYISDANLPVNGLTIENALYVGANTYGFQGLLNTTAPTGVSMSNGIFSITTNGGETNSKIWIGASSAMPTGGFYSYGLTYLKANYGNVEIDCGQTLIDGDILFGLINSTGVGYQGQLTVGKASSHGTGYAIIITPNGTPSSAGEIQLKPYLVNGQGDVFLNCSSVWGPTTQMQVSDITFKKDIVTIPNALDRTCALRGVNFRLKDDTSSSLNMGLVAQEVEPVFPEVVATDKEGKKSINYTALVGALVEAIKAQEKEIQALKAEVEKLKKPAN